MEKVVIQAEKRTVVGKQVKALRREGKLPAVIYGHGIDPISIVLDAHSASRILAKASSSTLVTIELDGVQYPTLVREKQLDFIRNSPIHVDFLAVSMTEKLTASVGVHIEGEAPAVKEYGAILVTGLTELEVVQVQEGQAVEVILDALPDLAPYAARSRGSRGRKFPEALKDDRPHFERDRDRVIHCAAFRRLEYKTQVFVNHEGDYYRTRLTHTLEVAQISKGIARRLKLNEDLAESIALAHDLGHTPFGHTGEDTLDRLMRDCGGFEHNRQSLRIVEELEERYPNFPGLNLTWETREGLIKRSRSGKDQMDSVPAEYMPDQAPSLEAQIIGLADEIAYNNHDIDDGLEAGYLGEDDLLSVAIWRDVRRTVEEKYPEVSGKRKT